MTGRSEVKIRVLRTGLCGTDLHIIADEYAHTPPIVLGHEFTGVIEACGGAVKGLETGDQVMAVVSRGQWFVPSETIIIASAGEGGSCGHQKCTCGWVRVTCAAVSCALADRGDERKPCR